MSSITVVGRMADGTVLGEDDDGAVRRGVERYASWADVERTVETSDGAWVVTYHVGDHVIGKATLDHDPGDYTPEAKWSSAVINGELVEFERQVIVIDWED